MEEQLTLETYNFISKKDKEFIVAFDKAIREIGYESGCNIGNGYCWGRYMIIYKRTIFANSVKLIQLVTNG